MVLHDTLAHRVLIRDRHLKIKCAITSDPKKLIYVIISQEKSNRVESTANISKINGLEIAL